MNVFINVVWLWVYLAAGFVAGETLGAQLLGQVVLGFVHVELRQQQIGLLEVLAVVVGLLHLCYAFKKVTSFVGRLIDQIITG